MTICGKLAAGRRNLGCVEADADQHFVYVSQRVDPGDGLLSEVTTFDEADRPRVAIDFLRQVRGRDVLAKQWKSPLDPRGFQRREPASFRAGVDQRGANASRVIGSRANQIAERAGEVETAEPD